MEAGDGTVGTVGGEVADAIARGEVLIDGEGATSPRATEEDGVKIERVATVSEGANFGKEEWLKEREQNKN